jgi:hypothetical protein
VENGIVLWLRDDLASAVRFILDEIVSGLWLSPFTIFEPKSIEAGYRDVCCDKVIIIAHLADDPLAVNEEKRETNAFEQESVERVMKGIHWLVCGLRAKSKTDKLRFATDIPIVLDMERIELGLIHSALTPESSLVVEQN